MQYDLVIIGGGIAGSSLAISMAGAGADVLLLERETRYRDRVRGEIIVPWGSVEAKKLGIYDTLVRTCAIEVPYHSSHFEGKLTNRRDLVTTTPENTKSICFVHAKMQEALISQALDCGVDVRRGARASGLTLGTLPKVQFRSGGCDAEVASRIVVGADGKNSKVRQWADLSVKRDPDRLMTCGLLVNGVKNVVDSADYYFDPSNGRGSYVLPVGENQTRLYLFYHHGTGYPRFSGERDFPRVC